MGFFSKLHNLFNIKEKSTQINIIDIKNNEIHNLKLKILRLKLILVLERAESKKAREQLIDICNTTTQIADKIYNSAKCKNTIPISTITKYKKEIINNESNCPISFYLITYQNSPLKVVLGDSTVLNNIRQNAVELLELSRNLL